MTRTEKLLKISSHTTTEICGFVGDYKFLSNMYDCKIIWHNLEFNSVEAAYQASKCKKMKDAKQFCNLSGYESKQYIRNLNIRSDWEHIKYNLMCQLVFQKFLINEDLNTKLCNTLDRYLEETNYWNDTYWGVCNGIGENNLGKILMNTRRYFINI